MMYKSRITDHTNLAESTIFQTKYCKGSIRCHLPTKISVSTTS